jgi:hypothetical protein
MVNQLISPSDPTAMAVVTTNRTSEMTKVTNRMADAL